MKYHPPYYVIGVGDYFMENQLYYEEKFKNIDKELDEHNQRITANEKRIIETDKSFAVSMQSINGSLGSLSELPKVITQVSSAISQMGTTMELMQVELKRNTEEIANVKNDIAKQSSHIKSIDDEGKMNIRLWIRDNWVKLLLGAGSAIAIIEYIAFKFPK